MWCVPFAIARILSAVKPTSKEDVWAEIRAERRARHWYGKPPRRITNLPGDPSEPHGGTHAAEGFRVLTRRGFTLVDAWPGRSGRRSWQQFAATLGREGVWLLVMPRHLDLHIAGRTQPWPGWEVHKAWRVYPPGITPPITPVASTRAGDTND